MSNFSNYANAIVKKMNEIRTNVFLECEYVIPENTNVPPKRNYLNKFKNDSKYASYNIEKKKNQKRSMKNKIIKSNLIIVKDNLKKYIDFNKSTKNINKMPIIFIKNKEYALNYSSIKKKKRKKITF